MPGYPKDYDDDDEYDDYDNDGNYLSKKTCFVKHVAVYLRLMKRWHVSERHMCISTPEHDPVCLLYKLTRTIHNSSVDEEQTSET